MKYAQTESGTLIEASEMSPTEAICPHCGGSVNLRHRRRMNNEGITYYWRHRSNEARHCTARKRLA